MGVRMAALMAGLSLGVSACSSDSGDGGGAPSGDLPAALSGFCTGTLTTSVELMEPMPPGGWVGHGDLSAPAGKPVLLADGFDAWEGYVFDADGAPFRTSDDLVKGTHFTSQCAPDGKPNSAQMVHVLLASSTFYASEDLSGAPCSLPAGTVLGGFGYMALGSGKASVSAEPIKSQCQMDESYSKDVLYADLLPLK